MFSADTPNHTHSLRPKRTRQAAGSDDSIKLPQAKRKRSALGRDTFEPLTEASINEVAGRGQADAKTNGHPVEGKGAVTAASAQSTELTIRNGKKTDKRADRGTGGLLLASNDFYNVSQLPSLPDQIRSRPNLRLTCVLSAEYGYALALTHPEALIWPYNSSSTTPPSRDVISFKLPKEFARASQTDPLPLATFTARSVGGEPGIVIVSPKTGKVVYWDTITNASTTIPGQTSSSADGTIPGLMTGETVQELVSAEPAGFLLTFSHGRVAHLTVRDQMGRPAIGVQFLRKSANSAGSGLFGSIRNVFSGDRRKGTPLVKSGASSKGQRTIAIVTEDAELEVWQTTTNSGNSMVASTSFREVLSDALVSRLRQEQSIDQPHFDILDFEIASSRHEVARREQSTTIPLVVLLSLPTAESSRYFIAELTVSPSESTTKALHRVTCYSAPVQGSTSWRPRLIVSPQQPLAFLVFESAIVMLSLAKIQESPSSQLLMERQALPDAFQDSIRFQEDAIYRVLGCMYEEHDQYAACLLAVQGYGLVRFSSHFKQKEEIDVDEDDERILAKTKLEQAVFYGTIKQNPLDLQSASLDGFDAQEIRAAAQAISLEILTSSAKHLPRGGPSVDMQMKVRAKALDDLIHFLIKHVPGLVSRDARYQLLWNAEKLAAAQAIWKVQEEIQRRYPLKDRELMYLEFTLRALHENRQKYPDAAKGEKDRVRHWLLNSVDRVDHLLSELVDCFREFPDMAITDPQVVGDYYGEALDIWIAAYSAALKFREDNAAHYGLGDDTFKDGVLLSGFPATAGPPWTSLAEPLKYAQTLPYDVCDFLKGWWDYDQAGTKAKKKSMPTDEDGKPHDAPPRSLLESLAARLPKEVEIFNRLVTEEIITAVTHVEALKKDSDERRAEIASIKAEKRPRMVATIEKIAPYNMDGAIRLAEHLNDPGLLVGLTEQYLRNLALEGGTHPDRAHKILLKIEQVQDHTETYYDRFKEGWAYANFSRMIENGELGSLLATAQSDSKKQDFLTWFMKKGQKLGQSIGKLSWINDVVGQGNYARAAKTLASVAEDQEDDLSNQTIEFSLAKLSNLAALEDKGQSTQSPETGVTAYDRLMEIANIQERVTMHVDAAVGPAIDEKAAEELAVSNFTDRVVVKSPALKKLLRSALRSIIGSQPLQPETLVDLLTLIDPVEFNGLEGAEDPDVLGNEFALALQVVELSKLSEQHKEALRYVIWRRAMIRDDWTILNDTRNKDDIAVESSMHASALFRTLTSVLSEAQGSTASRLAMADLQHQLISPSQILELDSVFPQILQERFIGDDKEKDGIKKDLEKEQKLLKTFVDKAQLELHWSGLLASAERSARGEGESEGGFEVGG